MWHKNILFERINADMFLKCLFQSICYSFELMQINLQNPLPNAKNIKNFNLELVLEGNLHEGKRITNRLKKVRSILSRWLFRVTSVPLVTAVRCRKNLSCRLHVRSQVKPVYDHAWVPFYWFLCLIFYLFPLCKHLEIFWWIWNSRTLLRSPTRNWTKRVFQNKMLFNAYSSWTLSLRLVLLHFQH